MRVLEVGPFALPIGAIRSSEVEYVGVDSGSTLGPKKTEEAFWRMVELLGASDPSRVSFFCQSLGEFARKDHGLFDVIYMGNVLGDPVNNRDIENPFERNVRRREILSPIPRLLVPEGQLVVAESITPPSIHDVVSSIEQSGLTVEARYIGERFWEEFSRPSIAGEDARMNHEIAIRRLSESHDVGLAHAPYLIEAANL